MLKNKVAIITGGANGIGKATALKFMQNGAKVAIWDIDKKSGEELANKWIDLGYRTKFYESDTTNLESVTQAAEQVYKDFGSIDILINNAGITRDASMKKMSSKQWQQVIDVNLTGVFNTTKAVVPYMIMNNDGRIVNASSVVGIYGNFGQSNYVATKAGVIGLTKVWAKEFGKYGITVNAVAPGFINTEMIKTVPENIVEMMKSKSQLNRLGETVDIANAYLYLSSEMASFVTGTTLSVDGGLVI